MATKKQPGSKDVVAALNREQCNSLVAYLNYKKYHWLTFGPNFRDLHLLFEEHALAVHAMLDELAERALMIDGKPVADPARYLSLATVTPSSGEMSVARMVTEAAATHDQIIGEMHADAETAAQAGDIGTADLFTRLVQTHQKHRWFLQQVLRKKDALQS